MLNELEQKIRKAVPELRDWDYIQLNQVLEYVMRHKQYFSNSNAVSHILIFWNLKSNLLSEQSEELIKFINEL